MLMLKGGRANSGIVNELLAVMMRANVCLTKVEEHESRMAYHLLSLRSCRRRLRRSYIGTFRNNVLVSHQTPTFLSSSEDLVSYGPRYANLPQPLPQPLTRSVRLPLCVSCTLPGFCVLRPNYFGLWISEERFI